MTWEIADYRAALRGWLPPFLALAAIWGASFLFIKLGVRELHPLYVALGRVGAGALALLVIMLLTRDRLPREAKVWGHLAVLGALTAAPFTLFGYGEQHVSSVLAGIWNATTPLVVFPVAVFVFRTEKMTARRAAGIGLGFAGVLIVLGAWQGVAGSELIGQLMCFGAAVCYGFGIPYLRRFMAGRPESGVAISTAQLLMATLQLAVIAPLVAGPPPALTQLSPDVIGSVLALGALGTGVAFALNFRVIRLAGASTSASVTYVIPVVATLIGVGGLGEHIAWHQPVGAAVILLGVAVSQGLLTPRRAQRRAPALTEPLAEEAAA